MIILKGLALYAPGMSVDCCRIMTMTRYSKSCFVGQCRRVAGLRGVFA